MKTLYKINGLSIIRSNFVLVVAILFSSSSFAALSGSSYVIDKGGTASATVYKSFNDFISDLESGSRSDGGTANGPGVSGAVTVTVKAKSGPYTEQINISAITGASSSNTITIDGNGETIQYTATSSSASYTIRLTGADHFIFDNLVVKALDLYYGRCFHLMSEADDNVIQNCQLDMPNMTSTNNYNGYILLTNGTTSPTGSLGAPGQNNVIKNNITNSGNSRGPFYAFAAFNSSSTSVVQKNTWEGNTIQDFHYYGIYTYFCIDQTIINNEITNQGNSNGGIKYAIYLYNYYKGGGHTISGNYIHDLGPASGTSSHYNIMVYGYYGSKRSEPLNIKKNTIIDNHSYVSFGIYLYLYQNKITGEINVSDNYIELNNVGSISTYSYGIYTLGYYMTDASSFNVANNELKIVNPYSALGLYNLLSYSNTEVNIINNKLNMSVGRYGYPLYSYAYGTTNRWTVAYNTIYLTAAPGATTGNGYTYFYFYSLDSGLIYNNQIYSDLDNYGLYMYAYFSTGSGPKFDYNNVYIDASFTFEHYYWGTTTYSSLQAWMDASGGKNNYSVDPKFADPKNNNLTPLNEAIANKGMPVSGISTDYRGIKRSPTNPDIGCYEYFIDNYIVSIDMTGSNECGGYREPVVATIMNNSDFKMDQITMSYTLNGGSPVTESFTVNLDTGKTAQVTFDSVPVFNGSATHTIEVFIGESEDNGSLTYELTTVESPFGGDLSADPDSFAGYYRAGILTEPDVTAPGTKIEYTIVHPKRLSNSNFDSLWTLKELHMTSGGMAVGKSLGITYNEPDSSGPTAGTVSFDPDPSLVDSLVFIGFEVTDLNTGCDSIFGRWVYVPYYPTPDYQVKFNGCDGDTFSFTDKSTMDKGKIIHRWNFDDPNSGQDDTSDFSSPIHLFSGFGTYNVNLTTWNEEFPKFTFTKTQTVQVYAIPEIAFKVKNACAGQPLSFQNLTSLPGGATGTIKYLWDFADGSPTTTTESPTHLYNSPGRYLVALVADHKGCQATLNKNASQYAVPVADFTVDAGCNNDETRFNNKTTIELGSSGYIWDFGDGTSSNLKHPTHTFALPGSHTVRLTAISEFGCEDKKEMSFTLKESPKADFTFSDPCNLSDIDFTRTGSIPPGNSIYTWDFNGESMSTKQNPSYRFNDIGLAKVSLTITSENGCSNMTTRNIFVKEQAKADFSVTDVCDGEEVTFINKSYVGKGSLTYTWRFGDQATSMAIFPRHRYSLLDPTKSETFNVTLVAHVLGGCDDSVNRAVTVNAGADPYFVSESSGRDLIIKNQASTNVSFRYFWRFGDGGNSTEITPAYTYVNVDKDSFLVCLNIIDEANCQSEYCTMVTIDLLGMDNLNLDNGVVEIYPNPSADVFNVKVINPETNIKIAVISMTGVVIYVAEPDMTDGLFSIDLGNAAEGVYLLQVRNGDSYAVKRIAVVR